MALTRYRNAARDDGSSGSTPFARRPGNREANETGATPAYRLKIQEDLLPSSRELEDDETRRYAVLS